MEARPQDINENEVEFKKVTELIGPIEKIEEKKTEEKQEEQTQQQQIPQKSIRKRRYSTMDRVLFEIRDLRSDLARNSESINNLTKKIEELIKEIVNLKEFVKEMMAVVNLYKKWSEKTRETLDDTIFVLKNIADHLEKIAKSFDIIVIHEKEILAKEDQILEILKKWKLPEK